MQGRKVYVQVVAVVFESVRLIEELQVRVLPEKCFDLLVPMGSFFVYHETTLLQCLCIYDHQIIKHLQWATPVDQRVAPKVLY